MNPNHQQTNELCLKCQQLAGIIFEIVKFGPNTTTRKAKDSEKA
jgi:hypothetical protein